MMRFATHYLAVLLASFMISGHATAAGMEILKTEKIQIEGGVEASAKETPWQVALIKRASMSHVDGVFCGGVLLDAWWVLTAAHCLHEEADGKTCRKVGTDRFWVAHSSTDLGANVSLSMAEKIVVPSGYDCHAKQNDIALVRLVVPVAGAMAIRLPTNTDASIHLEPKRAVKVSGWGLTSEKGWKSRVLLEVSIPVVSQEHCRIHYPTQLPAGSICAGEAGKHACTGDSGGPLYVGTGKAAVVLGIVSFGDDCGKANVPGVFAPVLPHKAWIAENMSCKPSTSPPFTC